MVLIERSYCQFLSPPPQRVATFLFRAWPSSFCLPIKGPALSRFSLEGKTTSCCASPFRSISGEHQRWKSRPPERVSVVRFICSGEDGRLRFWGVSLATRLLAGDSVATTRQPFLHCIERDDYNDKAPP